ncbi:MAG: T9SS type A sorting domain-containing protein [Bacteroidetes bacterium]|nr:T9SS type A sorting domain-containing protein [Bacteroidota bacterium]MCW5897417.1 T9SS type A sorting domain-containing protein [Bacteroidota bacterium]
MRATVICVALWSATALASEMFGGPRDNLTRINRVDTLGNECLNFPFPQNATYPFGLMPNGRDHAMAYQSYLAWKNNYVTTDGACGFRRVVFNDMNTTYSEGIGYGMLLAVNAGDQELFDDLFGYYNNFLDQKGLMHWWIGSNCQVIGITAATDADQDVAFALLQAHRQWCSEGAVNYLLSAQTIIDRLYAHTVEPDTYVLKPGDSWGGSHVTNPSYFAPAYYRAFREATGNAGWDSVVTKCYEILNNAAHHTTGLVPDWCQANGQPANGFAYYYYYDATRTPWRVALDYLWYGDQRAYEFCKKISNFARGIGAPNILEGYHLNGTPLNWSHINVFIGPFGAGAMATDEAYQAFCDSMYDENVNTIPWFIPGNYYNYSLRTLTLFLQTGNFLNPNEVPLPVHLAYFRGRVTLPGNRALLEWGTLSELNNYGFEIQKRTPSAPEFATLPNSFIPGHGTTLEPQFYSFADNEAITRPTYYRLKQIDLDGRLHFTDAILVEAPTSVHEEAVPVAFSLYQNFPNPFNPSTRIRFGLPNDANVKMSVHNTLGQLVAQLIDEEKPRGYHEMVFRAEGLSSGVYYCTLRAGGFVASRKLILVK